MSSYALSTNGSTRGNFLDRLHDKLAPKTSFSPPLSTASSNMTNNFGLGSNRGLITSHPAPTPSSAVKKHTTTDTAGNTTTTEYHAPLPSDDPSYKYRTDTGELNKNYKDPAQKTSASGSNKNTASNASSSYTANPQIYGQLVTGLANQQNSPYNQATQQSVQNLNNSGTSQYNNTAQKAIQGLLGASEGNQVYADRAQEIANAAGKKISDIGGQGARGEAGYLTTGTSPIGEGNAAVLAQTTAAQQQAVSQGANMQLAGNSQGLAAQGQKQSGLGTAAGQALAGQGTQQSAFSSAGSLAQSGQSNVQGALGSAAGYAQPQFPAYGSAQFNPVTGQYDTVGGGQYGSGPAAGQNVLDIGAAQGGINTIDQNAPAFKKDFNDALNYAQYLKQQMETVGIPTNIPIAQALQKIAGTTLQGNPAVSALQSLLERIKSNYQAITGNDPSILDNATFDQLQQQGKVLDSTIKNKKQGYQDFINKFNSKGSPTNKGGNLFGSFFGN